MQTLNPPTQDIPFVYASKERVRTKRRADDGDPGKPGNSGPGKSGQNTSGSTTGSMKTSMRGPLSASQATAPHTTSSSSTTMVTPTTPTTSLPPKPSNHQFIFNNPQNTTTCGALQLSWVYGGQAPVPMSLVVQDQTVSGDSGSTNAQATTRTLTNNTSSDADVYLWSPVDVDEGWYLVKASDTGANVGISAQSAIFFVSRGPDIKCLPPNITTTTTTTFTNANAPTLPPTNSTSVREALGTGDIIGIALGVTIGVAVLVLAYVFPRLWHRELPDPKNRRPYLLY